MGGGPGRPGADTEPEHSLQQGEAQPWVVVPSLEITPRPCGGAVKCWGRGTTSRYFAPGQSSSEQLAGACRRGKDV